MARTPGLGGWDKHQLFRVERVEKVLPSSYNLVRANRNETVPNQPPPVLSV